jgi:pSer/pThr/pTyr-binding forkhead associated (FHA) protein
VVLQEHAELAPELSSMLRQASLIEKAAQKASGEQWLRAFALMKQDDESDFDTGADRRKLDGAVCDDVNNAAGSGKTSDNIREDCELLEEQSVSLGAQPNLAESLREEEDSRASRRTLPYLSPSSDSTGTSELGARKFRPSYRAATAILEVYDDDQQDVERIRIRKSPFIIGREGADIAIPHDNQISHKHACLELRRDSSANHWYLRDLKSKNGTYLRVPRAALRHKDHLLLGGVVVRFLQPEGPETASLINVLAGPGAERVELCRNECWIGTDTQRCLQFLSNNEYLDPHHIRFMMGADKRWRVCDENSTNGVYVRISEVKLQNGTQFQTGEQRFRFCLP